VTPTDLTHLQPDLSAYGEIAVYIYSDMSLAEPGQPPEMTTALRVSTNFFKVFGIPPREGRPFRADEELEGNHRVLVISNRMRQNRFGSRDDIIGHTVRINGEPNEIIGVMPETFNDWRYMGQIDVFRPLGLTTAESTDQQRRIMQLLGRRTSGIDAETGAQLVAGFGARLAETFPATNAESGWRTVSLDLIKADPGSKLTLTMLIGLSGFVLLIACSNLANLLLARTIPRAREIAVRAALGASRRQLIRPLAIEAVLLPLAGGVGAVCFALGAQLREIMKFVVSSGAKLALYGATLGLVGAFGISRCSGPHFPIWPSNAVRCS
jgi:putative ABC transport system permease protein